jgi:hypothetical protein
MKEAPTPETLKRFADIVGENYALAEGPDQEPYLREWRHLYKGRTTDRL